MPEGALLHTVERATAGGRRSSHTCANFTVTGTRRWFSQPPTGCWIKDKLCSQTAPKADSSECTNYPNLCNTPYVPLDLQYRSTTALKLSAFWPQNDITSGGAGSVWYDDMLVAKSRIGCVQ